MRRDPNRSKRTLTEFRELYPNLSGDVLAPLLDICNRAVDQGATWEAIGEMLIRREREHPGAMPLGALLEAVTDVVEPEGELPEGERRAIWDEWRRGGVA